MTTETHGRKAAAGWATVDDLERWTLIEPMREMLLRMEWGASEAGYCPTCGMLKRHAAVCDLADLLEKLR